MPGRPRSRGRAGAAGRGDTEAARDHALWGLQSEPGEEDALRLLVQAKARANPLLGTWWRLNSYLSRSTQRAIAILVAVYLLQRLATLRAVLNEREMLARLVACGWLALCGLLLVFSSDFPAPAPEGAHAGGAET